MSVSLFLLFPCSLVSQSWSWHWPFGSFSPSPSLFFPFPPSSFHPIFICSLISISSAHVMLGGHYNKQYNVSEMKDLYVCILGLSKLSILASPFHRSAGTGVQAVSPASSNLQSPLKSLAPPGRRKARPATAMGSRRGFCLPHSAVQGSRNREERYGCEIID